ncbi:MAG: tetratricopeptide repeat protein [Thermodesulfobacteriota bacterium]|nr:tetratricopeptide repeat protein [Thermodesulfobacteriota bacterium]
MERSPYSYQLLIEAGKYFANIKDPKSLEKATYIYELAQELVPSKRSIALDHARVLRKLKRYNEALDVLNTWLDHYGGNDLDTTITKSHRAYIYLQMGQPEKALTSLGRDIESYQAGVIMNVARAYEDMGQITKAAQQYQKVLKRYPTVAHVISGAAGFFWRQGEFELAAQIIAMGRPSQFSFSRWYFEDFIDVFRKATNDEIYRAVKLLEENGASSWELCTLGWKLAKEQKNEVAFKIISTLKEEKKMLSLENTISAYTILLQWKGRDSAKDFLRKTISKNDRGPMMMVLYKDGLFDTILDEIGNPDDYGPKYREFMWLQMLIAWLACDKQPADLESLLSNHYQRKSSDYYHAIGSYMFGHKSLEDLLGMIHSPKQQCEFAYYIGLKERLKGNFKNATQWYHLCRETLLSNNGEFHWASDELFWWAHMGIENRHRLVSKDIETYRTSELSENLLSF